MREPPQHRQEQDGFGGQPGGGVPAGFGDQAEPRVGCGQRAVEGADRAEHRGQLGRGGHAVVGTAGPRWRLVVPVLPVVVGRLSRSSWVPRPA
ncbi:hypothetical protein XF36_12065 [Pseudonocardia sp. HH130629-09]|nr:hypothetical protein XF36_12065 [Pseudonocardia sp. HH130629-09]